MATYGLTATAQGSAGDIHLSWSSEPSGAGCTITGVNIFYKTASWHLWQSIGPGVMYANDFSASDNYTYEFKLGFDCLVHGSNAEYSETVSCTRWVDDDLTETLTLTGGYTDSATIEDTLTETLTLTDAVSEDAAMSDTLEETLYLSDSAVPLTALSVDYQYYFGSYDGQVYTENKAYLSDAGTAIDAYINLKQGDFADQDPKCLGQYKTIYFCRLWYVDEKTNSTTTLRLSSDGGQTWTDITVPLGNGDGTVKSADFYKIFPGHTITPRLQNNSSDQDFQWIALEMNYVYSGRYS